MVLHHGALSWRGAKQKGWGCLLIASQKSCFLLVLLQGDRGVPWEGKVRTRQADAGDRLEGTGGWVTPSYVNGVQRTQVQAATAPGTCQSRCLGRFLRGSSPKGPLSHVWPACSPPPPAQQLPTGRAPESVCLIQKQCLEPELMMKWGSNGTAGGREGAHLGPWRR